MIMVTFVLLIGFAVGTFLMYRGFQIVTEEGKLFRLLLQAQHKELTELIKNFNTDFNFVMGGELGQNLKKYLHKLDPDFTIVDGKVMKIDKEY